VTEGFLIGLGAGVVTAWFLYWRIVRLISRIGIAKEDVQTEMFGRLSYDGLLKMRERLDKEMARRSAPERRREGEDVATTGRAESS